ncbi:MAG: ABC transporter ATP-binding protein [Candidatus Sericytochromatia bacterium]|nr:ABC transporter ATP-binding protein [Candidatus Sericytochromatia bacterium]
MTASSADALRLVAVHRRYAPEAPPALDGVELVVARGEMVALMGPSGCGKSTLLHLAGLIDAPDTGHVVVDGRETASLGDDARTLLRRERIGFVSQFFNLLPTLTAAENVALPLVLAGQRGGAVRQAVSETLAAVGLGALGDRYPHQLSGGQMQRVAIGRAIVHRPALLLADEPTGSLDSATGEAVLAIFRDLNARQGQTVVLATHAPEAAAGCSRVVRLRDGRIVSDGRVGS